MKWSKETAQKYIHKAQEHGLKYWSAKDYLKNHGGQDDTKDDSLLLVR